MKTFIRFIKQTNLTQCFHITILIFVISSISCAETPGDSLNKDSQKYLSFYETVEGETIHWEVNFEGDEIISIYKNGKQIPDDLVADYKDKVHDQLDEMRFGEKRFSFQMPVSVGDEFDFDFDELNKELEKLKKDLPKPDEDMQFYYFDNEEFKQQMEELKKELEENKAKIFKYKFDEEKFKKQMEELKRGLKENPVKPEDINFYFEYEENTEV